MFKNSYQGSLLSVFYSCGSDPLSIWDSKCENGHIKRITDNEVNSLVLEIVSTNVANTYITCPKDPHQYLGIKLPFMVLIVKNLKRYFSFEITIIDDKKMRRRFRISNFQSTTKIKPFCTTMPIGLSGGWNQIQFNLADFTKRAYGSSYLEAVRVQVHANVRLRRIYFCDRLYTEEELPQDYKLYLPLEKKKKKGKEQKPEAGAGDAAAVPPAAPPPAEELKAPVDEAQRAVTPATTEGGEDIPAPLGDEAPTEKAPSVAGSKTQVEGEAAPAGEEGAGEAKPEGEEQPTGEAPAEGEAPAGEGAPAEGAAEAPAEGAEAPPAEAEAAAETPAEAPAEAPAEEPPAAE